MTAFGLQQLQQPQQAQGLDMAAIDAKASEASDSGNGIDALTRLAAGNPHLVTNPGLLQAINNGTTTPQQASAINSFMAGLKLQTAVEHLRDTGNRMEFTSDEQNLLGAMNVKFDDVSLTPAQALAELKASAAAQGLTVAQDANGNVIYGADGTPVLEDAKLAANANKKKSGGGGFWHDVGHVFSYLAKPFNVASSTLGEAIHGVERVATDLGLNQNPDSQIERAQSGQVGPDLNAAASDLKGTVLGTLNQTDTQRQDMRDAGYDPNNPFSIIAFRAAGKDYFDTTSLADAWSRSHPGDNGAARIEQAKQYLADPGAVTTAAELNTDPAQRAVQLQFLNSKPFQDLVAHVAASRASIGNAVLDGTQVDPVTHPKLYAGLSAGIDLASAFSIDPLLVLGKASQAAKISQVGLQGFRDAAFSQRIHDVLLGDTSGLRNITQAYRANVQRGMRRFIDNVNTIREATASGAQDAATAKKIANAYADIRATTPALEPLIGDFTGATRFTWKDGEIVKGENGVPLISSGEPITNLAEAADYLGNKLNYARLMSGRAAVEWNLMPGSLSAFGARALVKANLAPLVGRSASINMGRAEQAMRVLPWANDAVDENNQVVAAVGNLTRAQQALDAATHAASTGDVEGANAALAEQDRASRLVQLQQDVQNAQSALASARRAATVEVMTSPRLTGEVQANMLRRGTLDGQGFNLGGYLAANAERAVRRLTSFLPREQEFRLSDASSADKFYKFMQLYTSRSDAALGAARFAAADEGTRRAMYVGMLQQVMHAAGFGATEGGRAALERVSRMMDNPEAAVNDTEDAHRYTVMGSDLYDEPRLGGLTARSGVLPGHVQDVFYLPSFSELARDAAQSALWRRTFGPMYQSKIADLMTFVFKTLQLMKPSTWTRNMVEGLANAAFRGELGAVLKAKAAAIDAGAMPERGVSRIFNPKNWNAATAQKFASFAPLAKVGEWYRHAALRAVLPEDGLHYIEQLSPDELEFWIKNFSSHHLRADLDPSGSLQTRGIIRDGLTPQELTHNLQHDLSPFKAGTPDVERAGYAPESANGLTGADRWAGVLNTFVDQFPEFAGKLMDAVKAGDGDVSAILEHIAENPQLAAKLNALRLRHIVTDSETGVSREAITDEDRQTAIEQLARRQVEAAKELLIGRDGNYIQKLDDYIRTNGTAPSSSWLKDNIPNEERPYEVLAPKFVARPPVGGVDGFARSLAQWSDKWYARLVEDPIQHTTSLPVFLANYGKARYFLADAESQLAKSISQTERERIDTSAMSDEERNIAFKEADEKATQVADHLMKQQAVKMSWVRTEQIIDDPGLKTQFDIVGRNFFMYSRATQAMIRRWGQAIMQNPARLQKAALALNAAEHAGMIYHDKNGELTFIYPGSGPLINGIINITKHLPGFGNFAQMPVTPDLTGKVLFAAPGVDNPLRMPLSPLVNVPYRMIEAHVPAADRVAMDNFDRFVNGPIGAGQIGAQFMPAGLRNLMSAMSPDERKSQWASAATSGLSNLIAADPDGRKGIVPGANATPADNDRFILNFITQTKNVMYARWALGLFTPAPASLPTMATDGSKADPVYAAMGYKSLRDEYQKILNDFGGDVAQANQLWAEMHPDKLIYETPLSHSLTPGKQLPTDNKTFMWLLQNDGFVNKYKAVAAYFIPPSPGGEFSSKAYNAEMALGMRERYSPSEFFNQVRINQGAQEYWPSWQAHSAAQAQFKANKDTAGAAAEMANWDQWQLNFADANPLFMDSLDATKSSKGNNASDALRTLREMLQDPALPTTVPRTGVQDMIASYDAYKQWEAGSHGGGSLGTAQRRAVVAGFDEYMTQLAQSNPILLGLYNGVFRPLVPALTNLSATSGA